VPFIGDSTWNAGRSARSRSPSRDVHLDNCCNGCVSCPTGGASEQDKRSPRGRSSLGPYGRIGHMLGTGRWRVGSISNDKQSSVQPADSTWCQKCGGRRQRG
jgi:hypothetical protein